MPQTNNFLFESLNKEQIQAVSHINGPLLVVAGAGSGKTKALTHRIANLIQNHDVNPRNILAVTFTNKAAKEMKERVEIILAKELCKDRYIDKTWTTISQSEQNLLKEEIYKEKLKDLWIGTFHSLFSRLLRLDIEKYEDPEGLKWKRTFSIYDEKDSQTLIKEIIKEFNLSEELSRLCNLEIEERRKDEMIMESINFDSKKNEKDKLFKILEITPKRVKFAISNAKNKCLTPKQLEEKAENVDEKIIAEIYKKYRRSLSNNNALDFDDLILLPVFLLKQNKIIRDYWHKRFRHILVDEYQDTNETQYELIKLITTNTQKSDELVDWANRSIFVVGDADQSIYSFRAANFKILMNFRKNFGINLNNEEAPMIKLEKNYRSTSNILNAANKLIENNSDRIEKVLKATRESGDQIKIITCGDEVEEAETVINKIEKLSKLTEKPLWRNFAILYRTRSQSRLFDRELTKKEIPFKVFGLRFYDRKEIKDVIAYLRVLVNSDDDGSLLRILNVPSRGIGPAKIDQLKRAAEEDKLSLLEIIRNKECIKNVFPKIPIGIQKFIDLIEDLNFYLSNSGPSKLIQLLLEKSGYWENLKTSGSSEDAERILNLNELINDAIQYEEESEIGTLEDYLSTAALSTDTTSKEKKDTTNSVTLMTLHNSKGLEFKNVFITGLEQGLFPSHNAMDTLSDLEEERRLCYVGITRAEDRVFLTNSRERLSWGKDPGRFREPRVSSIFLEEIDEEYSREEQPLSSGTSKAKKGLDSPTRIDKRGDPEPTQKSFNRIAKTFIGPKKGEAWNVGDKVLHRNFGIGEITKIMGEGEKVTLIVKFAKIAGNNKVLDPRWAPIQPFGK